MDDLIDRQATIDAIRGWVNKAFEDWGNATTEIRCFNAIYPLIMSLPSAQPQREKSEWIEFDSDEEKYDIIKCPYCKHIFTIDSYHWTDIGFVKDDFKFCPNCGADMRGEEHGTDI